MADRTGKCSNYTKCTIAYRNEPISGGATFACPECGQPLTEISSGSGTAKKPNLLIGGAVAGVVVLGLAIFFLGKGSKEPTPEPTATAEVSTPEPTPAQPEPSTPAPAIPEEPI